MNETVDVLFLRSQVARHDVQALVEGTPAFFTEALIVRIQIRRQQRKLVGSSGSVSSVQVHSRQHMDTARLVRADLHTPPTVAIMLKAMAATVEFERPQITYVADGKICCL